MADTTAPFLRALNLPATIYLKTTVTLTSLAQDDSSGVKAVQIWLSDSVTQVGPDKQTWSSHVIYFGDEVDSFFDGESKLDWTLSAPTDPGIYTVLGAHIVDKVGNERTYSTDELKSLGMRTSFNVSGGAPPAPRTPATPPPNTVVTATSTALSDDALNLMAKGGANIRLAGNASGNAITGNTGKNVIDGGAGDDRLDGKLGNDTLKGGAGQDAFVFTTKPNKKTNVDKIADFNVNDDSFQLDNAVFKKLGKKGSPDDPVQLSKAFFTIGSKAKDKNDYLVYDSKKGVLYYDADGSGSGAAVQFATLSKKLKLSHKDFFVI